MASVYKKNADVGNRKAAWYFSYVDEKGKWRQKKGFTDKTETEKFATKLEDEARMVREGLKQATIHPEQRTVEWQLVNYLKHLSQRDVSSKQLVNLEGRIRKIADACKLLSIDDIKSQPVEDYLAIRRKEGMGKQTSNHYRQAIFQFCRWLVHSSVLARNPVADIPKLNVQTDRRHDRRALSEQEFIRLVEAAVSGPSVESIEGSDRAMMYILSAWTGYRRGEIGSLTISSFDLESNPPTVTVSAAHSKRRKRDVQVLHPEVVARLQTWLSERKPKHESFLFPISKEACGIERKTAKMMRIDLENARKQWLAESGSEEEIKLRTESDFLSYKNQSGLFADFHANRHTFITNLAKGGVSPKVAQTLARHSDMRLTMNVYTHTDLAEKALAISKLPSLEKYPTAPEVLDASADSQSDVQQRYSSSCETEIDIQRQPLSPVGGKANLPAPKRNRRKALPEKDLAVNDDECHRITEVHPSGVEPETFGFVGRCSIQLSYGCLNKITGYLHSPICSVDFLRPTIANSSKQASKNDSIGKPDACKPSKPDPAVQLCSLASLRTAKKIKKSERLLLRSLGEINPRTAGGFYLASGGFYLTVFIWRCVAVCGGVWRWVAVLIQPSPLVTANSIPSNYRNQRSNHRNQSW